MASVNHTASQGASGLAAQTVFEPPQSTTRTDFLIILGAWFAIAVVLISLARNNLYQPGGFYDEVNYGGLAKDFVSGQKHNGQHYNGSDGSKYAINLFNRPFPLFVMPYASALKCWLLLPTFSVFGANLGVLRMTSLGLALCALLLFMWWTYKWLGRSVALVFGVILGLDPSFFFGSLIDWGSITSSFLCKGACFYFVWLWWQSKRDRYAVIAAAFAGLGFFNKVDVAVVFAGAAVAATCAYARPLLIRLSPTFRIIPLVCLGFVVPAFPMLLNVPKIFKYVSPGGNNLHEKISTLCAMYDGSYFYHLIDGYGVFPFIYYQRAPVFEPLGIVLLLAAGYLLGWAIWRNPVESQRRTAIFLLSSTVLISLGILLTPGAVRLHHVILVYPFPHLLIAFSIVLLWRMFPAPRPAQVIVRLFVSTLFVSLLFFEILAIHKTQNLFQSTGGRGWWSESFDKFCQSVKNRTDLTIVSVDWGFNEQLMFETDGPTLEEPVLEFQNHLPSNIPKSTNYIFLVHPMSCTFFPCGREFLEEARRQGTKVDIRPYYDRQNQIAFYTIRYLSRGAPK